MTLKVLMTENPFYLPDLICFKVKLLYAFIDLYVYAIRNVADRCELCTNKVTFPTVLQKFHHRILWFKCGVVGKKNATKTKPNCFLGLSSDIYLVLSLFSNNVHCITYWDSSVHLQTHWLLYYCGIQVPYF